MNQITQDLIPVSRTEALEAATQCIKRIEQLRQNNWEEAIQGAMQHRRAHPTWKFWRKEKMNREQAISWLSKPRTDSIFSCSIKHDIFSEYAPQHQFAKRIKKSCEISTANEIYISSDSLMKIINFWPTKP